jgi:adenylate cyclase
LIFPPEAVCYNDLSAACRHGNGNLRYLFEDCALDTDARELCRGTSSVPVEPQVFDLLVYLIRNRDRVVSKDDLITSIWHGRIVSESTLNTRISAARFVIGDNGEDQRLIKTWPRKGIRFVGAVRQEHRPAATAVANGAVEPPKPALTLPDKPSIAVLAFGNLSGDPEQEYLADGIVEDIITELSRFSDLFVIARNSSFQYKGKATDVRQIGRELGVRYVLEGSVRRGGSRIRISAQLIDATTGAHRWADHYDRQLEDIFGVQDEVARTIASILVAHVNKAEATRVLLMQPSDWQAHDYLLRGADTYNSFLSTFLVEALSEARRLFECSIAIDPGYARAYAALSNTYTTAHGQPGCGDYLHPTAIERAYHFAAKAVQLEPNLPVAHAKLGIALAYRSHPDEAIAAFEMAIALNPNFTDWRFAIPLVFSGQFTRAIEVAESHMRVDPFYPPLVQIISGFARYMLNQSSDALPLLRAAVLRAPNARFGHVALAATYLRLGRIEEARAEAAEVL